MQAKEDHRRRIPDQYTSSGCFSEARSHQDQRQEAKGKSEGKGGRQEEEEEENRKYNDAEIITVLEIEEQ